MPRVVKLIIADDHPIVRKGLHGIIAEHPDLVIVGEASTGDELLELLKNVDANVLLLDISMPGIGGIEAAERIIAKSPSTRVLMMSMHDERGFVAAALSAGASGFVAKRAIGEDLLSAIRAVAQGQMYLRGTVDPRPKATALQGARHKVASLSRREHDVLVALAYGHTNNEIASQMSISAKTVATYRSHVAAKLGLNSRAEVVTFALETGLRVPS